MGRGRRVVARTVRNCRALSLWLSLVHAYNQPTISVVGVLSDGMSSESFILFSQVYSSLTVPSIDATFLSLDDPSRVSLLLAVMTSTS